jgi:simple sugar transport system ATP-binding protein
MTAVLEARGIEKRYGQVEALAGADFTIEPGEVVALIGDNGAGKSTLVRILSGSENPDVGSVFFEGNEVRLTSPVVARSLGMETVFQDLALVPHLDPIRNLFLGREIMKPGLGGRLGFMDNATMRKDGETGLRNLGAAVRNFTGPVGAMSGGQKQSIAVARAALWAQKVIFLDEPTAALGVIQTKNVLDLIKRVRDTGIAVVFISHSMPHVMEVADRITVLRRGRSIVTYKGSETNMEQLVGAMTGALNQEGAA